MVNDIFEYRTFSPTMTVFYISPASIASRNAGRESYFR